MSHLDQMPSFTPNEEKKTEVKDEKVTRGQYEYVDPTTGIVNFFETPEEQKEAIAASHDRDNK